MKTSVPWSRASQQGLSYPWAVTGRWQALRQWMDARRIRTGRRAYYDYLGHLLHGSGGSRTLKQIFAADAQRYGRHTSRGRLSHHWLHLFQAAGGDLYATWFGVFPVSELAVLRSAQAIGNQMLIDTLAELSRVLKLHEAARAILRSSLLTAVVAFLVLMATLLAVPFFTVPKLRLSFAVLPPEYYGSAIRSLLSLSEWVELTWPVAVPGALLSFLLIVCSFSRYTGPARRFLDGIGPWRIYRQVQALRLLSLLAVALGRDEHGVTRLRLALSVQLAGATPWLAMHVETMLQHVDGGRRGAEVFDTGLLDPPHLWFLDDMIAAGGLVQGLSYCSAWVERHVLGTVARQASVLRWCLLLISVLSLLMVALWHYTAMDDLRRGLALFYATQ